LNTLVVQYNSVQFIDVRLSSSEPFTRPAYKYIDEYTNTQVRHKCAKTKTKQKQGSVISQHNMPIKCLICYRASLTALDQL